MHIMRRWIVAAVFGIGAPTASFAQVLPPIPPGTEDAMVSRQAGQEAL